MIKLEFENIEEFNAFVQSFRGYNGYYTTWTHDGVSNVIGTNVKMPSKNTAIEEPRCKECESTDDILKGSNHG